MGWTWDPQGGGENNGGLVWDGAAFNAEVEAQKRQWQQDMVAYRAAQGLPPLSPAQLDDLYNQRVAAVSAQDNRNHNVAIASMIGGGLAAAYGGAAGAGAGETTASSMEMAPAWTAAETASAGGAGAVVGASESPMFLADAGSTMTDVSPGLLDGATMPAAVPELAAANAVPGSVTAGSGMGNAVTAGAAGTSGAVGILPGTIGGGITGTQATPAAAPLAQQVTQDGSNGPGMAPTDSNGNVVPPNSTGMDTSQNPYQFPYQNIFQGLFGAWTGQQQTQNANALLDKLIASDQWRTQAPRYYEPLNDAVTKGLGNTAYGNAISDQTMRKASSLGYNMSGNMLQDLNKGLNASTLDYAKVLTPLAMGRGETSTGTPALTSQIVNGNNMTNRAYGGMLENIFTGSGNNNQNLLQSLT